MVKKTTPIVSDRALTSSVALPASTGSGVTTDVDVKDVLRLGEHQNDDIAGDLAASDVTRPVVAVGAIVEPVNRALASEPAVTGDAAGDAAIAAVGAGPEFVQPVAVSMESLRPDTFGQSELLDPAAVDLSNTPERSATTVEVGAGNSASLAAEKEPDLIVFDLGADRSDVDLSNLRLVAKHYGVSLLDPAELRHLKPFEVPSTIAAFADAHPQARTVLNEVVVGTPLLDQGLKSFYDKYDSGRAPYIRITSAIAGFRRGGIAHPKEPVEYRLEAFAPADVEAILAEPNLVAEII